ncbi:hypothetical protein [Sporosarcina highlanderae]|uniref:Lipoprotein n=1 Tax=Sporosarcina highlanderae TaxID=3035916 RepID=A0ABT8JVR4_9BACL|nr:hypothetical protein [Sporosarcina highlanderae]MDN4609240.1 hypothetical protein [Sporosarcina highlanderae]
MKMNRWFKLCLVACLSIVSIFSLSACDNNKNETTTIKQQLLDEMKDTNMDVEEIIHLEVIKDGIVVFYTKDNELNDAFIKLKNAKWEWYFGGGSLPLQAENGFNWSFTNFDQFYVRYGVISDDKIKRVKDEENNYPKIIEDENGFRMYFFLDKSVVFDNKTKRTHYYEILPEY